MRPMGLTFELSGAYERDNYKHMKIYYWLLAKNIHTYRLLAFFLFFSEYLLKEIRSFEVECGHHCKFQMESDNLLKH